MEEFLLLTCAWDGMVQKGEQVCLEGLSTPCVSWNAPVSCAPHQPLTPAEERKVLSLVSKHGPDKLYQVTSNISGSRDLDLTLLRGQIVALLQSADTKGNTSRWLVDAGGTVSPGGSLSSPWHRLNHFLTLHKTAGCGLLGAQPKVPSALPSAVRFRCPG